MRAKYILSEVMVGLWRNVTMTVAMIITMAVSLTMLGASLVLYQQIDAMKGYYYDKVEVSIFLRNDITRDQQEALKGELANDPLVKQPVTFETKDQAYEKFKVQFKDALLKLDEGHHVGSVRAEGWVRMAMGNREGVHDPTAGDGRPGQSV